MASYEATTFVLTKDIKQAVEGREQHILDGLGIPWPQGRKPHIDCPYPNHGGKDDWRWDDNKGKAFCTCSKGDSILDVIAKCDGLDFEDAKIRAAEIIGRQDLIKTKRANSRRDQATDAASLLNPAPDNRDDSLVRTYLASRLEIDPAAVVMPATAVAGLKALGYFEASDRDRKKYTLIGEYPCAVFGTVAADGKRHAHRIYLAPDRAGKADLPRHDDGSARDPKKSARAQEGDNTAGRSVLWGDPAAAPWIIVCEGVETGAALAVAFRPEVDAREVVIAAAITAGGVEAFQPYPATKRITVAADRDEKAKPGKAAPSRRGEKAARTFGLRHYETLQVDIALPGQPSDSIDWLDVLRRDGANAVRVGIKAASAYVPTTTELEEQARQETDASELAQIAKTYPLPAMDALTLSYERTAAGKIKVHHRVLRKGKVYHAPVATPFGVPARLRLLDQSNAYGLRIVVQDMGGRPREIDVDRAAFAKMGGAEIKSMLFSAGLRVEEDGEQIAVQCLKAADPEAEILIVKKPGMHTLEGLDDPIFVCPDGRALGAPEGCALELSVAARIAPSIARGGTLERWKEAISAALSVRDCKHWGLGILAGFAAPLISLTGLDTCGVNLSGLSSSGKTTAQKLAVSAWSKAASHHRDSLLQSAKTTVNGVESTAARSSGTILALDELAHVSGKELGRMIYTFAGGVGKRRMAADATMRESYSWSTFVLLSAESSLEEKIRGDGGEWTAGMAVRVPDVDVTGVNRRVDKATMARIEAIDTHFGHAGPAFVQALVEAGQHRQADVLRAGITAFAERLAGKADSTTVRAALPFAILHMAGLLARGFGLIPTSTDVHGIIKWAWVRFQRSTDAMALDPEAQAITNLRTWIAEHWDSSIQPTTRPTNSFTGTEQKPTRDALGWYDEEAVYLPAHRLREAAGGTLKETEIAKALHAHGLIAKTKDQDRYLIGYVPKIGKVKAYALSRSGFGRTDLAQDPDAEAFKVHQGGRL